MTNHAAGFETLEDEITVDGLPVQGELPSWLRGSLIRTGPARFEANGRSLNHWFDGQAMLHRFSFSDGAVKILFVRSTSMTLPIQKNAVTSDTRAACCMLCVTMTIV